MPHLLVRLCLALACTATIACEEEGPDTTTGATDATDATESSGDEGTTAEPGTASMASTLAPPPGEETAGEETAGEPTSGTTGEEPGPTTLGPPKDAPITDVH